MKISNLFFFILFFSGILSSNLIDESGFDESFKIKDIKFERSELLLSSNWDFNPENIYSGYEEYESEILRIKYKLSKPKLSKQCTYEKCSGVMKNLFDNNKSLETKLKNICYENNMNVMEYWVRPYDIWQKKEVIIDCTSSTLDYVDYIVDGDAYTRSQSDMRLEEEILINELSIERTSISVKGTSNCGGKYNFISFSGPVDEDTTEVFKRFLSKIPRCLDSFNNEIPLIVFMDSGGGLLKDGFAIGRLLRNNNVFSKVVGMCASSCATAFLGANKRYMSGGSKLLFHAPYKVNQSYYGKQYINCQSINDSLREYYMEMLNEDDGDFLYERTMDFCSNKSGWTLNDDAARLFGIIN